MRKTAGYTWTDYKTERLQRNITPFLDKIQEYRRNRLQHIYSMPHNRLPRVIKYYYKCETGTGQQVAQIYVN
jgi:hypothetical protein